jgi:hypothetical protein
VTHPNFLQNRVAAKKKRKILYRRILLLPGKTARQDKTILTTKESVVGAGDER